MIRRTLLASPTGRRARLSTTPLPVSIWPQTPVPPFPTRWSVTLQPKAVTQLPIDAFTTAEEAVIRAALPGVNPENIEVSVYQNMVSISAQQSTHDKPEGEQLTWLVAELGNGSFQRTIRVPFQVDEERVEAQYANGMLQLVLPKVEAEQPHRISVQVRSELSYELTVGETQEEPFAAD
jgi:HSP20 family protein